MKPVFSERSIRTNGFTIVELLVVVVILGILAAITIVAYSGIQDRARFSTMQSDLKTITKALELYKTDVGGYPITIGQSGCTYNWCGWDQATGDNFITGIAPTYASKLPQLPTANAFDNTYLYQSNGTHYQLIRYNPAGLTTAEKTNNPLLATTNGYNGIAWGYRTNTDNIWW